jgi:cyclomaltodextrinase / maltogenic alpha-amylase / neopullulanase
MTDQLPCGVYEHYKGKKYLVLGVASHTESGEIVAVYVPLYEHSAPAAMAVRPLAMFLEQVVVDGVARPRFRYLGTNQEVR